MTERPILFSAPMVRAILDGTKTQARRVVKPQPFWVDLGNGQPNPMPKCPFGKPGDRLWVRETWAAHWMYDDVPPTEARSGREDLRDTDNLWFGADGAEALGTTKSGREQCEAKLRGKWRPSIHMPRWVSRITLEVTGVRVERLQAISEADAIAEGVEHTGDFRWRDYVPEREAPRQTHSSARESFLSLWESISGTASLAANPWVWVVELKRVAT